jgi:mycofactocin glycosyltransferase
MEPELTQKPYSQPAPGYYRLAQNIRIVGELAICDYPLRVLRLSTIAARLLHLCAEQHTCEELADHIDLPVKRIETLCQQLRWKGLLEAGPARPPATWPGVSIIIPSHNRAYQLERCLRSLFALNYPADSLEIIVVDDASTDETSTILQQLLQEPIIQGKAIHIIRHADWQGVASSRNSGAEAAHYGLLAYIDSDCVASPNWLTDLVPVFQDAHIGAVGGIIRAYERHSMLGRYEDVHSSLFMGNHPQQVRSEGPLTYLPTANFLVRRPIWQQLNGFAPLTFGEDVDFCRRLLNASFKILYLPQGNIYHDYRTRLWPFISIHALYASSEAALHQRHPTERRILLLPPEQATFAALLIGGLWGMIVYRIRRGRGGADIGRWFRKGAPPPPPATPASTTIERPSKKPIRVSPCDSPGFLPLFFLLAALLLTLLGVRKRLRKVRRQRLPIGPFTVLRATLRGHLSYTYHLCRHLTRYYTLPLLIVGILLPPLLLLALILIIVVIAVDYIRLRPDMSPGQYAFCSLLDDCAYEVGVVLGSMKHKTWKPLLPIIKLWQRREV